MDISTIIKYLAARQVYLLSISVTVCTIEIWFKCILIKSYDSHWYTDIVRQFCTFVVYLKFDRGLKFYVHAIFTIWFLFNVLTSMFMNYISINI